MAIRTAEDAGLPTDRSDKDAVRPRTDGFPAGNADPMAVEPPATDDNLAADDSLIIEDVSEEEVSNQMRALDILTYFPHAPRDPLQVHGWDYLKAFGNVSPAQVTIWSKITEPKILLYKAYGGKVGGKEDQVYLRELIRESLQTTEDPVVATPIPDPNRKGDGFPPCALIRGILAEKAEELIRKVRQRPNPPRENTNIPR